MAALTRSPIGLRGLGRSGTASRTRCARMEDNIYYRNGRLASSNAEFVGRAARLIEECDREVAKPSDARALLGLPLSPANAA